MRELLRLQRLREVASFHLYHVGCAALAAKPSQQQVHSSSVCFWSHFGCRQSINSSLCAAQQVRVHGHDSEKNMQDWPMASRASTALFFTAIVLG